MKLFSAKQAIIAELLADHGSMYGLELVSQSGGELKRGTVYVCLGRMEDRGWLRRDEPEGEQDHPGLPRPRYALTLLGERALIVWRTATGILEPEGARA